MIDEIRVHDIALMIQANTGFAKFSQTTPRRSADSIASLLGDNTTVVAQGLNSFNRQL